ncbi:MAG: helix-turn-helix transcriptional regulator [Lentisphaeria bacterium]|nr:helix-turn-helix transcriptional regulator [Lentisphaeria bacterium]
MASEKVKQSAETPEKDAFSSFFSRKLSNDFRTISAKRLDCKIFMIDCQQVFPVKKQDYRLHIHQEYEVIIPHRIYHCRLNNTELTVNAGELLILQPGDSHQDHLDPDESYNSFRFSCQMADLLPVENILKDITPEQHISIIRDNPSIFKICDLLWDEINNFSGGRFLVANGIFQGFFWEILFSYDKRLINENLLNEAKKQSEIRKFLDVMHRHLHDFPDIPKLCREMGMSRSALSRLSVDNFGHPPLRMLMYYKMQYAGECLHCLPQITIKELSDKLGFSNQFHFSKVYKRFFNVSPSKHLGKHKSGF